MHVYLPPGYDTKDGARFTVNFSKARHLTGGDAQPFEVWLKQGANRKQFWEITPAIESDYLQTIEMTMLGLNQTEIAQELGINKASVCRHIQAAIEKGHLTEIQKGKVKPGKNSYSRRADIDG